MESLTTLNIPAIGYGIRYEFGLFHQEIQNGWQVEKTDKWLSLGNPWEISRPEIAHYVGSGGHTEQYHDEHGHLRVRWIPEHVVRESPTIFPSPATARTMTNFLRLWSSEAVESFDFQAFNKGDYYDAVHEKVASETISKVLYPNDEPEAGKVLRLQQQYFFTSCSLQDMIRIHKLRGGSLAHLPRNLCRSAQRHPSVHRRRRTDAAAGGHPRHGLGRGVEHYPERRWPTPITRCCPRRWRSGRCRSLPACCPAL